MFSFVVPFFVALLAYLLFSGLARGKDYQPFLSALGIFVLCFIGIGISFYPHIVPPALTIAEAAAPDSSLAFLLVGAAVLVPVILIYTAYAYWVFRGKVAAGEGYH
jgi:cytochrome d ubiquinol oxidase subunit II